jgi:hypothetical protein
MRSRQAVTEVIAAGSAVYVVPNSITVEAACGWLSALDDHIKLISQRLTTAGAQGAEE